MKKNKLIDRAICLRSRGYSIKEIAKILEIAQSTSSDWLKDVILSRSAKIRLLKRIKLGQFNSAATKRRRKQLLIQQLESRALAVLLKHKHSSLIDKIYCAIFYWCEGAKDDTSLKFTNSDPDLLRSFIYLLRKSFEIDENKFRPIIHLHPYHDERMQLKYWSGVLKIPIKQFMKSWRKQNTGKRVKQNYQGCVTINYYDSLVAKELIAYAKAFLKINRPVG